MKNPTFTIYTGPMFGSKTTRLIADIDRLRYKGKKVESFKPKIDKRYSEEIISTHNGANIHAMCIDDAKEIYNHIDEEKPITIAIDEAFMISNIDKVLIDLFRKGFSIIVSSIQLDANETPFENIKNMLPWATKIEICSAVCTMCDKDAYYTEALFDMKNTTQEERIGEKNKYQPRCAKHYTTFKGTKK